MPAPRTPAAYFGHALAAALGVMAIVAGCEAFAHSMPNVMGATLLVVGALMPVLAYRSLHGSRAAWAFLIALVAVFGAVDFFGAPKVRDLLGVGLSTAMLVPLAQAICVGALASIRASYR